MVSGDEALQLKAIGRMNCAEHNEGVTSGCISRMDRLKWDLEFVYH